MSLTIAPTSIHRTIRDLLRLASEERVDAPCLLAPDREPVSYGCLWRQSQYVADFLRSAGLDRESRVAALLPNGLDAATASLSFGAACVYAPLNVDETAAALEASFARLSPSAVLVQSGHLSEAVDSARRFGIPVMELSPAGEGFRLEMATAEPPSDSFLASLEAARRAVGASRFPDDLALLMQTSGTTGEAKLAMHTHRTLCAGARALAKAFCLTPDDCGLNVAPLFHSLGLIGGLWCTVASGGSIVCTPGFDPSVFFAYLERFAPTWFSAVPTMMREVFDASPAFEPMGGGRRPLRFFRTVAAPMPDALAAGLERVFRAPLIRVYGMTEVPPITCEPFPPAPHKHGSVGIPVEVVEMEIWDDDGVPVPQGQPGHVAVRGPNVAVGYFNNPRAECAAFRHGWFQTGDNGYLDPDGYLFLTGRVHDVINRGGEKIGPGEIEEAYATHPDVAQAVAFAVPDDRLGEEVALAVVTRQPGAVTPAQLQRFGASSLAFHKIPRRIFLMDEVPTGPSGKPLRTVLRQRAESASDQAELPSHVAPRTELESALARLWRDVIGGGEPGINDHFFNSGGDSLTATRLVAAIEERFLIDHIPMGLLMEAPTIAELAARLSHHTGDGDPGIIPLQPGGSSLPLFFVGAGMEMRHLIDALPPSQPVFAVRVPELRPGQQVPSIASQCVEQLRRFRPNGPYLLAGWCASGLLAMEMARILLEDGEEAPLLAMFDARGLIPVEGGPLRAACVSGVRWLQKLRFHIGHIRKLPLRAGVAYAAARVRRRNWQPRPSIGALARDSITQPYPGRMVHFLAADRPKGLFCDVEFEWGRIARGGFDCYETPGNHSTMFHPPNVKVLAGLLAERMAAAESADGRQSATIVFT